MNDGEDFMTQLPAEISSHILSVLDAESLLACAAVNRAWDEMTNRLRPDVWYEACLEAGISVDPDKYQDARDWKAFLSSMTRRLSDMKTFNCYEAVFSGTYEAPITGIYCRNEKIAIAYVDCVHILDASDPDYYVEFEFNFDVSLLKLDDNILVVASSSGYICSCSIAMGTRLRDYIVHGTLFDFDFFTDYSILVSSVRGDNSSCDIYLWSMERLHNDRVHKIFVGEKIMHRLIIAPIPHQCVTENKKFCFLFGLFNDCVFVWIVQLIGNPFRSIFAIHFNSLAIPPSPDIPSDVSGSTPYGFLFDGNELYITAPSPDSSPFIVWVWNIKEDTICHLGTNGQILNLLGVGAKYLVYNARDGVYDAVYAVDKFSNELIAYVRGPRTWDDSHICLGQTSWLDGLNGENDRGVVFLTVMDEGSQVLVVKFAPRRE